MLNNPTWIDELCKRVAKHDRDLYEGNGKPALTVRMALAEERIDAVNRTVEEIRKDSKAIKMMVLSVILAIAGDIIVKLVVH